MKNIPVFKKLVALIKQNSKEITNKNKEEIPSIYYIGLSKTASASLMYSFPNNSVAHWHNIEYFESIYKTDLLTKNKLDLVDLVLFIGKRYNFEPLLVECIREPISNIISNTMQHLKKDRVCSCELCKWKESRRLDYNFLGIVRRRVLDMNNWRDGIMSIDLWNRHFGVNLLKEYKMGEKYFYREIRDRAKLLLIRFEDIKSRKSVFEDLNFEYSEKVKNVEIKDDFLKIVQNYIRENISFTESELRRVYGDNLVKVFYSDSEVEEFCEKYREKKLVKILDHKNNYIEVEEKIGEVKNIIYNVNVEHYNNYIEVINQEEEKKIEEVIVEEKEEKIEEIVVEEMDDETRNFMDEINFDRNYMRNYWYKSK